MTEDQEVIEYFLRDRCSCGTSKIGEGCPYCFNYSDLDGLVEEMEVIA